MSIIFLSESEARGDPAPADVADYESDVWKVMGNVMSQGFGDMYYEAVDWQE